MSYKVGSKFRFKDDNPNRDYPNGIITRIVHRGHYDEIWFITSISNGKEYCTSSSSFINPGSSFYGIIQEKQKEFTDEEYEGLLV